MKKNSSKSMDVAFLWIIAVSSFSSACLETEDTLSTGNSNGDAGIAATTEEDEASISEAW